MALFSFYRFYASLGAGVLALFLLKRNVWAALLFAAIFRTAWFMIERFIGLMATNIRFKRHVYEFKQQLGPYGIHIANKAENDRHIKKSLAEVFVPDVNKLQKTVDQLKLLETLYQAGMTPDAESRLLHDCKLKYAIYRPERHGKKNDF